MLPELNTLFTSAKTAYGIAKGISSLKVEVERNESVAKVLEILLSVEADALTMREKYQSLLDEKERLAKQLVDMENWEQTKVQYQLTEVSGGIFVQAYNKPKQGGDPPHWACEHCFQDQKRSVLQLEYESSSGNKYFCQRCKNTINVKSHRPFNPYHNSNKNKDSGGWSLGK